MNKDINKTLMALVPILRMNNEKVQKIEAVKNWYTLNGKEYMKEVAFRGSNATCMKQKLKQQAIANRTYISVA